MKKELSLFDSTCIIVGIIIGVGIYEIAPIVAGCMQSTAGILGIWLVGGILALAGAICYSELATAFPRQGGDYVYLNRAYGNWAGYIFGFSQMFIIRPGDIALMAFVFARYASTLYPVFGKSFAFYAGGAIAVLTLINILGVKQGKWTQNILTVIKALGLAGIVIAGLLAPGSTAQAQPSSLTMNGFELALILVLFTFGGWNEMAYVAAEVKKPQVNIVRALITGTIVVTVLYLLANTAFLHVLGPAKMASSQAVAVDTVAALIPGIASKGISILVCISALGALNGLIFTGSRISYAMGAEHRMFKRLGQWNESLGTPVWALILQGIMGLVIVFAAGSFIDTILYTAPAVWIFFLATGLSVFVLRKKEPKIPRPYRITGYPMPVILFCACALFMIYSCVSFALARKPIGLVILCSIISIGLLCYFYSKKLTKQT